MADLFTPGELASYMQVPEVDNATVTLIRDLITAEIRLYAGPAAYDALSDTDLLGFKGIALEAAKRAYLNPSGLRSVQIDDYAETFATETFGGVTLTDGERNRIDATLGRAGGAFSVRPSGQPDCPPWRSTRSSSSFA